MKRISSVKAKIYPDLKMKILKLLAEKNLNDIERKDTKNKDAK